MITSRTPFRVSFAGGGTDLRDFYADEPGAVTAAAIRRYLYVTVRRRFDDTIRFSHSTTETVPDAEALEHPIARECLRLARINNGLEITSLGDIPPGTGLGSSSAFAVGLLHALHAYLGQSPPPEQLASEACEVEIERLGEPIGKQDQYAVAYGGLKHIQFRADGSVRVEPVHCEEARLRQLESSLMLFYTGRTRSASAILMRQRDNAVANRLHLRMLRDLAVEARDLLESGRRLSLLGELLHDGWLHKQKLAGGVSNPEIDGYYETARKAGAVGGRLLGAGGGGFLLLFAAADAQEPVQAALAGLRRVPLGFELGGSKIVYAEEDR